MIVPRLRALSATLVAILWLFSACVDTTPPWEKVTAKGGAGGLAATGGAPAIDGPAATGGSYDAGVGGAIDLGGGGAGGAAGGAGGAIDAPWTGAGGLGFGGAIVDVSVVGTGGAVGGIDGGRDVPLAGAGGGTGTGGTAGIDGGTGTGGTTRTGGAPGSGGTTSRDAAPDLGADVGPDLGPEVGPDLGPGVPDANPLLVGLVAYYKCDETSGTTLADSSGNNHHGTLGIGVPADGGTAPSGSGYGFAAGKVGGALTLTRAGYGHATLPPAIFNGLADVTVATWVWVTTSADWQRVFDVGVKTASYQFVNSRTGTKYMNLTPKNTAGDLRWSITSNGYGSEESLNTTSLSTGIWTHVAVVLTGGNGFLYIDGAQAVTDPTVLTPAGLGTIDYAYLGRSQFDADPYFDGMLDEFRVYSRAFSAAEVQALYQFTGP